MIVRLIYDCYSDGDDNDDECVVGNGDDNDD